MKLKIEVINVNPLPIAVARIKTSFDELNKIIPALLNQVYDFLKSASIKNYGHNVVFYLDEVPTVEVGVLLSSKINSTDNIICSSLPGGSALRAIHTGSYHNLPKTHSAVRNWANENGKILSGKNWEIYGDWNEDPARLQTEIYYLLREGKLKN